MFKAPFTSAKGRCKTSVKIAAVATDQPYFLVIDSFWEVTVSLVGIFEGFLCKYC
jgi:hypothetical protein